MAAGPPADEWSLSTQTSGPEETRTLAAAVARCCRSGDILALTGDLGAGKTTFAQGFGRGLGVEGPITSPTFTLVRDYPVPGPGAGPRRFLHADLYRLDTLAEVEDLALPELVDDAAVALVEWGERGAAVLGRDLLVVHLAAGSSEDERLVELTGRGPGWSARRDEVAAALGVRR